MKWHAFQLNSHSSPIFNIETLCVSWALWYLIEQKLEDACATSACVLHLAHLFIYWVRALSDQNHPFVITLFLRANMSLTILEFQSKNRMFCMCLPIRPTFSFLAPPPLVSSARYPTMRSPCACWTASTARARRCCRASTRTRRISSGTKLAASQPASDRRDRRQRQHPLRRWITTVTIAATRRTIAALNTRSSNRVVRRFESLSRNISFLRLDSTIHLHFRVFALSLFNPSPSSPSG